jgi:hypothetical protein
LTTKTLLAFSPFPRKCSSAIGPEHAQAKKRTSKTGRALFCGGDRKDATQPKYRDTIQEINLGQEKTPDRFFSLEKITLQDCQDRKA